MKKIKFLSLLGALLLSLGTASAQVGKPLNEPTKKPILYDDTHQHSMESAKENLVKKKLSATRLLPDLTTKQKKTILCLEKKRDNQLTQIDGKISALNQKLSVVGKDTHPDAKAINSTKAEIEKLQSQRMQVVDSSQKKIRSLLTNRQKKVFDQIYMK